MSDLGQLLWRGQVDLSTEPLNAMLFRGWNPDCKNIYTGLMGAISVSDPTYLGGMFWKYDDPGDDGHGPGWALEPNDKVPDFFLFQPTNDRLPDGGGPIDVVVYVASSGVVVSWDRGILPGIRGAARPSPLHDAARVHRIGNGPPGDPRARSWFWEATEVGGLPSMTYWATRMWFSGQINFTTMPLRVLIFDDTWAPTRRQIKQAVTIADIPPSAVIGVSEPVPLTNRHTDNGFAFYGLTGEGPGEIFTLYAVPVLNPPEGRTVAGAAIYHDGGAYEVLRISRFSLMGPDVTAGVDPVWVAGITMSIL